METVREDGLSELFWAAFTQSRNPMVLLDDPRLVVDVNRAFLALTGDQRDDVIGRPASSLVVGGPVYSPEEWATRLAIGHFTGETELRCGGDSVLVQWGVDVEVVTARRLILLVALSMSRCGRHLRRVVPSGPPRGKLSEREREVVRLVARRGLQLRLLRAQTPKSDRAPSLAPGRFSIASSRPRTTHASVGQSVSPGR